MPEAIVAIVIISVLCGTTLGFTGMILKHRRESKGLTAGDGDSSIRTSELKALMVEAAEEAILPLEARIDELQKRLEPGSSTPLLEASDDASGEPAPAAELSAPDSDTDR